MLLWEVRLKLFSKSDKIFAISDQFIDEQISFKLKNLGYALILRALAKISIRYFK